MDHTADVERFKQRVRARELLVGTWIMGSRSPSFIRLVAAAGFDFVLIDTQHVAVGEATLQDFCDVASACGLPAVVRVPEPSAASINRVLDLGAAGIMCPDVRTPATVLEAVQGMRFPPHGRRSAMGVAPGLGFSTPATRDDLESLERGALLAIQLESEEGVSNVDDLLDTLAVDVVDIGRGDLAIDYGELQSERRERSVRAVERIVAAARRHPVAVGTTCSSVEEVHAMVEQGVTFIAFSSDRRLLHDAYRTALRAIRQDQG